MRLFAKSSEARNLPQMGNAQASEADLSTVNWKKSEKQGKGEAGTKKS